VIKLAGASAGAGYEFSSCKRENRPPRQQLQALDRPPSDQALLDLLHNFHTLMLIPAPLVSLWGLLSHGLAGDGAQYNV